MATVAKLSLVLALAAAPAAALRPRARSTIAGLRPALRPLRAGVDATPTAVEDLKAELLAGALAVGNNGVGAEPAAAEAVDALAAALEEAAGKRGTGAVPSGVWDLLYTDSKGGSSGQVGPLVGEVTQTFEGDRLINSVALFGGAFRVSLRAECKPLELEKGGRKTLRIGFEEVWVQVFGVEVTRKPNGGVGSWAMMYEDDDLRVMKTNQDSIFILQKRQE
uniref:Plastid lipid-associated protein/fibrillin conserved domain-containing protein n=1 Tax=Phaeomonas parva TaxID=124430 RepID=A0A7S1XPC6_9STRA